MVVSTITSGRLIDHQFRRTRLKFEAKKVRERGGESIEDNKPLKPLDPNDLLDFPLERARLMMQPVCEPLFFDHLLLCS